MYRKILASLTTLLSVGVVQAQETSTAEQLFSSPQKFVGATVVCDHMQLHGEVVAAPARFRFEVTTPGGTAFGRKVTDKQRTVFVTPDKGATPTDFINSLQGGRKYPVRMTCEILKMNDSVYMAVARRIDLIRFEHATQLDGPVDEGVTVEDVVKGAGKYVGRVVVLDNMTLTGQQKNRPARVFLEVSSPAKSLFKAVPEKDQALGFATPDKSKPVMEYLKNGFKQDVNVPVRLACEVLKVGEGKYLAAIRRIDRMGYDYDKGEKPQTPPPCPDQ
jgi:hypothetical protein